MLTLSASVGLTTFLMRANLNQISQAQDVGDRALVLIDADTVDKGFGFSTRNRAINDEMRIHNVSFPYFIYPNNHDDGDVETLMAAAARRDLHKVFFDCFEDYEKCVAGVRDESGRPLYNTPNLKGKLHTYMNAQKLSNKLRRRLGSGDWLFGNPDYWDLDAEALQPLKDFLCANLK